jgi:hypothetical protein
MQYMLLIHGNEAAMASAPQAAMEQMMAAYRAYAEALVKAGVMRGGERLQVLNGPYAEVKEQLGGYYIIDVADLDAAISWAAKCPGASHGTMEVRPIWAM